MFVCFHLIGHNRTMRPCHTTAVSMSYSYLLPPNVCVSIYEIVDAPWHMVTHIARVWINRVWLPILLVVSLTGKIDIFLSAFAPENLVSRDGSGSTVSRQPTHLHTQAESGAYLRDSSRVPRQRSYIYLNRHTPSGQSRVYRVTQLRTAGVNCRESAGTGPVKPQGSSERVLPWQVTMDQLIFASLFHTHYWYEVGMLKVPAT